MITFLGALVTFSAFGAAILAFLTGGDGLDSVAQFWVDHANSEIIEKGRPPLTEAEAHKRELQRKGLVGGVLSGSVAVIQVLSGAGMIGCGLWLLSNVEHWSWGGFVAVCYWTGVAAFVGDAFLITVLAGVAVVLVGVLPVVSPLLSRGGPKEGGAAEPPVPTPDA